MPARTKVLVGKTQEGWVEVQARPSGWVKAHTVSTEVHDVIAVKLLAKAAKAVEAGNKEEAVSLLQKVESDCARSTFISVAREELAKLTGGETPADEETPAE